MIRNCKKRKKNAGDFKGTGTEFGDGGVLKSKIHSVITVVVVYSH